MRRTNTSVYAPVRVNAQMLAPIHYFLLLAACPTFHIISNEPSPALF